MNSLRDAHWLQVDSIQKLQEMTEQGDLMNKLQIEGIAEKCSLYNMGIN